MQVKLEDVFPMVAGQHMGSPFSHSAHIYQSRLVLLKTQLKFPLSNIPLFCVCFRLNYILGYHTTYVGTPQALQLRDETMAILRMAVEHWPHNCAALFLSKYLSWNADYLIFTFSPGSVLLSCKKKFGPSERMVSLFDLKLGRIWVGKQSQPHDVFICHPSFKIYAKSSFVLFSWNCTTKLCIWTQF